MPRWTDAGQTFVPVFARGCNSDGWVRGTTPWLPFVQSYPCTGFIDGPGPGPGAESLAKNTSPHNMSHLWALAMWSKLEVRSCLSKLYCDPQSNHQQSKIPVPQSGTWAEFVMECRECLVNFWGLFCLSAVLADLVHCMRVLVSCCLLRIGPSLHGTALKLHGKTVQRIAMLP